MNHPDRGAGRHKFTSPNFRHPVTLAKDLISLDDISGGRITLGIGAGGAGFDATALGGQAWTPRERADRFAEFLPLLDRLLTEPVVSYEGEFYSADEVRNIPGCLQRPRLPLAVAATGPRGLKLAARHGQGWVTYGDPRGPGDIPEADCPAVIAAQLGTLEAACAELGRDPGELDRVLLRLDPGAPAGLAGRLCRLRGTLRGGRDHRDRAPLAGRRLGLRGGREGLRTDRHRGPGPARSDLTPGQVLPEV